MAADPYEMAIEQYLWWRGIGLEPSAMLRALGCRLPYWAVLDTETVVRLLAQAERERAIAARQLRAA